MKGWSIFIDCSVKLIYTDNTCSLNSIIIIIITKNKIIIPIIYLHCIIFRYSIFFNQLKYIYRLIKRPAQGVMGTKINTKREKEKHIQLETKQECLV
jgi:hypothetical protein